MFTQGGVPNLWKKFHLYCRRQQSRNVPYEAGWGACPKHHTCNLLLVASVTLLLCVWLSKSTVFPGSLVALPPRHLNESVYSAFNGRRSSCLSVEQGKRNATTYIHTYKRVQCSCYIYSKRPWHHCYARSNAASGFTGYRYGIPQSFYRRAYLGHCHDGLQGRHTQASPSPSSEHNPFKVRTISYLSTTCNYQYRAPPPPLFSRPRGQPHA